MEKSEAYIKFSSIVQEKIGELAGEAYPGLELEVLTVPFGDGIRVVLMKALSKRAYPISCATISSLTHAPLKDIVHGLWGVLKKRAMDEIKVAKKETRLIRK